MNNFEVFGTKMPSRLWRWTPSGRRKWRAAIAEHYQLLAARRLLREPLMSALRDEYARAGGDPDKLGTDGTGGATAAPI
ncbi:MAG: hypothetical protein ACXVGN_01160 [Mycobacteriaceae bacterium]